MPIKVTKQGDDLDDRYTAEVIPPPETWRLLHPMPNYELGRKLIGYGE